MTPPPDERATDKSNNRPARFRILDKEVQIACKPGEEDDLLQAAAYIDQSMRDLRQRNNTSSIEKIAIVAAINTAHALLKVRSQERNIDQISDRLQAANATIDNILTSASTSTQPTSNSQNNKLPDK